MYSLPSRHSFTLSPAVCLNDPRDDLRPVGPIGIYDQMGCLTVDRLPFSPFLTQLVFPAALNPTKKIDSSILDTFSLFYADATPCQANRQEYQVSI